MDSHHDNPSQEFLQPDHLPLDTSPSHSRSSSVGHQHPLSNSEVPSPDSPQGPQELDNHEFSRPTNRVRFRSISNHGSSTETNYARPPLPRHDSSQSVHSVTSVGTLIPHPTTDPDHPESRDDSPPRDRDLEKQDNPNTTIHHHSSYDSDDSDTKKAQSQSQSQNLPGRSPSATARWRNAGKLLRQKTTRLGQRLGRPEDDGEALGASLLPDDLEMGMSARRKIDDEKRLPLGEDGLPLEEGPVTPPSSEAHRLVRGMTQGRARRRKPKSAYTRSGQTTPEGIPGGGIGGGGGVGAGAPPKRPDSWYSARSFSGGGILSQLLKLQATQSSGSGSGKESASATVTDDSDSESQLSSGAATPKKEKLKWYKKPGHQSTASLVGASMNLSRASLPAGTDAMSFAAPPRGMNMNRKKKTHTKTRLEDEIRVTVHIAEILARQRYIMQLCRALMRYGAPTHRLEEYMTMTARVLSVDGQFLYLPGCMIMSFDDPTTRTAEVKLVRMVQGVDLGRLADTHNVYKNVVHDLIGVEEAIADLDEIMKKQPRFNKWLLVPIYGLASVAVGPFAFDARPIDMPICFFLGSLVGFMQHVLAPKSILYSNVFEVTAAVLTSFLARAFGSIWSPWHEGERLFCFSALAQSSIALILPGFMVLCSSLELQSHQMIAGSIRMVYAIIYSLFLGYGITVGTTIYGLLDGNPTSVTKCAVGDVYSSKYIQHFIFVPIFAFFLAVINQAKWKQVPVMMTIALSGYVTNYFSTLKLGSQSEVANTVGAFTIGLLGNLYSRLWHGHAATAILPGIFVLVPSGLASSNSLIAGVNYANEVAQNLKENNGSADSSIQDNSIASLGFGMIQVAIGITVGLFISALVVYPFGKRRSGLFSF